MLSDKDAFANDIFILPHEAQYQLSLHSVHDPLSGIANAKGSMSYKLLQDCEGWISETSIMMDLVFENGGVRTFIWNLSTFESFDKSHYSFALEDFSDENNPKNYVGNVTVDHPKGKAKVNYTNPEGMPSLELPPSTIFPLMLYKNLIRCANEGIISFSTNYFDGSSPVNALTASAFITMLSEHPVDDEITGDVYLIDNEKILSSAIGFFTTGETPEFEAKIQMYNNGIVKELVQNIGPIDVRGQLIEIRRKPLQKCKKIDTLSTF